MLILYIVQVDNALTFKYKKTYNKLYDPKLELSSKYVSINEILKYNHYSDYNYFNGKIATT